MRMLYDVDDYFRIALFEFLGTLRSVNKLHFETMYALNDRAV